MWVWTVESEREKLGSRFSNQQVLLDVEFIQRLKSTVNDSQQAKVVIIHEKEEDEEESLKKIFLFPFRNSWYVYYIQENWFYLFFFY